MAFDAVAEDLVKEDAGGAAGENSRADERVGLRGVTQFLERGQGLLEGGAQHIVLGQARRILGVEALQGDQVLSIGGLAAGDDAEHGEGAAVLQARSFGVDQGLDLAAPGERERGVDRGGRVAAQQGQPAQPGFPLLGVHLQGRNGQHGRARRFDAEIGSGARGRLLVLHGRLHLLEALDGDALRGIGQAPEVHANRRRIVLLGQRRGAGIGLPVAVHDVEIVELGGAGAQAALADPLARAGIGHDGAERSRNGARFLGRHAIRDVVDRRLGLLAQEREIARQFSVQNADQRRRRRGRLRGHNGEQRTKRESEP